MSAVASHMLNLAMGVDSVLPPRNGGRPNRKGRPVLERAELAPAFRSAIICSKVPRQTLALRAGFTHQQVLSKILRSRTFVFSPRARGRLHELARILKFHGPITQ